MLYSIENGQITPLKNFDFDCAMIGVFSYSDIENVSLKFGIDKNTLELNGMSKYNNFTKTINGNFIALNTPTNWEEDIKIKNITFYWKEKLLIIADEPSRITDIIDNVCKNATNMNIDVTIASILLEIISHDNIYIEGLEKKLAEQENLILNNQTDSETQIITGFRRKFLCLKRYYEQFQTLADSLSEEYQDPLIMQKYMSLSKNLNRLCADMLNLRDYLSQVREAYQTQVDINLNNIMKFVSAITAIFLPLTLVTGWYGMNLIIPEMNWEHSYLTVIIISAIVATVSIIILKKKKWL